MELFRLVLICFTSLQFIGASTDPCESAMLIHENGGRSTECDIYSENTCDAYLIDGWYRFQLDATGEDLKMATEVVPQGRCGTVNPVWMNGNHPTVDDGIVDRVTCLNTGESTCFREYNTSVKNCGGYTVYYLRKTLGCNERYCFGNSRQCHVTTTRTTTTTLPTTTTTTTPKSEASTDPCESAMLIHENGGRSTECEIYNEDTCDAYLIDGWYRFQLDATGEDLKMATEVVPQGRCGTVNPVWMNGNHPTVDDGIVDRVTCLNTGESTCFREYNTSVKNCGGYTVYYLRKTLGCNERYCFGDSSQCHVTTTTTTNTMLPTTSEIPNMKGRRLEPCVYDVHGEDNQMTGLTIALSVTIIVLVVALVGQLLYFKLNYRPVVKQANANKIYVVNVLEKPPL